MELREGPVEMHGDFKAARSGMHRIDKPLRTRELVSLSDHKNENIRTDFIDFTSTANDGVSMLLGI